MFQKEIKMNKKNKNQTFIFKAQYGDRIQKSKRHFLNLIKKWFSCIVRPFINWTYRVELGVVV